MAGRAGACSVGAMRQEREGPTDAPLVSAIIPTHDRAGLVMRAVASALGQTYPNMEVIVVDDGSTDQTAALAAGLGARVLSSPYSMGNGAAIKRGARAAGGEVIVFMDADGQHDPACIPGLLAKLDEGYDMVVGARDWITPAHELENAFFPQAGWIVDAVHERIMPLPGHTAKQNFTALEQIRNNKRGV